MAFIPNPEGKDTVNHIDGNKLNNRADNLEWLTLRENLEHNWSELGRNSHNKGFGFFTPEQVRHMRQLYKDGMTCDRIAAHMGRGYNTVYAVVKGHTWKHVT